MTRPCAPGRRHGVRLACAPVSGADAMGASPIQGDPYSPLSGDACVPHSPQHGSHTRTPDGAKGAPMQDWTNVRWNLLLARGTATTLPGVAVPLVGPSTAEAP